MVAGCLEVGVIGRGGLKAQRRKIRKAEQRKARKERRARRRRQIACFWAIPWGHEFVNFGTDAQPDRRCVECDIPEVVPYRPVLLRR